MGSSSCVSCSSVLHLSGGCLLKALSGRVGDATASSCLRVPRIIVAPAATLGPCPAEDCTNPCASSYPAFFLPLVMFLNLFLQLAFLELYALFCMLLCCLAVWCSFVFRLYW